MELRHAQRIAAALLADLKPYCERIEIAGSIRREKSEVKDIELCAIPYPMDLELFDNRESLYHHVTKHYSILKPGRRTLAPGVIHPDGKYWRLAIKNSTVTRPVIDLFLCTPETWGMIYLIRTGSAGFVKAFMSYLHKQHLMSHHGRLRQAAFDSERLRWMPVTERPPFPTPQEEDVLRLAKAPYFQPRYRTDEAFEDWYQKESVYAH